MLKYGCIVIKIYNSFEDRLVVFKGVPVDGPEARNMKR
jgi:hypothetical protein